LDPRTMKPVYVPTNPHEKAMQRALIQYRNPKNYALVHEALALAKREDLIGFEKGCLIRPKGSQYGNRRPKTAKPAEKTSRSGKKKTTIERVDVLPKELRRGGIRRDKDGKVIPMKKHKTSRNPNNNGRKSR
ncbi:MAG: DUF3362 domain-containing protein, partial [Eubacteriales bacterium]